jgi:ethanolamine utilization cobalamin adenosyltransferase
MLTEYKQVALAGVVLSTVAAESFHQTNITREESLLVADVGEVLAFVEEVFQETMFALKDRCVGVNHVLLGDAKCLIEDISRLSIMVKEGKVQHIIFLP